MLPKALLSLLLILSALASPLQAEETEEPLSLASFAIPESLGKVQERFQGTSNFWVVDIQDIHGHPTAQENIAAILDHLQTVYGVSKIAVEGSWLETSLQEAWEIPNSREKQILARGLLEEGYLTGPGYAALFSPQPMLLTGMETPKNYQTNRQAYLDFLADKKTVESGLKTFHEKLISEKSAAYNPALSDFDKTLEAYRKSERIDKFLPVLLSSLAESQVGTSGLDQLELFGKIFELSFKIPKERLEAEAQRLVQKNKYERLTFEELLRSGKIAAEELEYYPASKMYLDLLGYQDQIDHQKFLLQLEEAVLRLQNQLAQSEAEKELIAQSENFQLLQKILTLKATPAVLDSYEKTQAAISALAEEAALGAGLKTALRFYEEAKIRDQIFFEKLSAQQTGSVAAVAGGFHTDGLSRKLREAGISYIVVTPDLGGVPQNEAMYLAYLQRPLPAAQTLSQFLEFTLPSFPPAFRDELPRVKETRNVRPSIDRIVSGLPQGSGPNFAVQETAGEFSELPDNEQAAQLEARLNEAATAVEPKVLVVDAKILTRLLASPFGKTLWNDYVVSNKQNLIVIAFTSADDIPAEAASGKRALDLRPGTVQEVVAGSTFQNRYRRRLEQKNDVAVILDSADSFSHPAMLRLDAQEISLLFRLFLAMKETSQSPEGYKRLAEILLGLEQIKRLKTAA